MRKYFILAITALSLAFASTAQVADLPSGYYRINNTRSDRYIHVRDNKGELMPQQTTADMNAVRLIKGLENAISEPSSVLYIEKHGSVYDIKSQYTGIYEMIGAYLHIIKSPYVDGAYCAYGASSGFTLYLNDAKNNVNDAESYLSTSDNKDRKNWYITPISPSTENYFGITPTINANNKYYQPFFADFTFRFESDGMKAFYVTKIDESLGVAVYKEYTSKYLPKSVPLFIECSSDKPENNKLNLGGDGNAINDALGTGVYFDLHLYKHDNYVKFNSKTMRLLGKTSNGSLGLVNNGANSNGDVPRNTFYVTVPESAPAELRLVSEEEYAGLLGPIAATGVTLSASEITLTIEESTTLTATVSPSNATDQTITWSSSNSSVAKVDNTGKVTATGVGTANITAKCGDVSATCVVTVKPIEATAVTLSKTSVNLYVGDSETITATVEPSNTTDKTVVWTSSNTSVATVSNGKITAIAVGNCTITAQCGNASATCEVIVEAVPVIEATAVTLSKTSVNLYVGDSETITATVEPSNTTDKTVVWTSSNTSVATVSNGKITAIAVGNCTITAKCGNATATCEVTVEEVPVVEATEVLLSAYSVDLMVGQSFTLVATVRPADTTDKTVVWTSSNTSIATVNNGIISAIAEGNATITATCGNAVATCEVSVEEVQIIEASEIVLSDTEITLLEGDTYRLIATVLPEDTTDKTVIWTSSNIDVVTVNANGNVRAIAPGEAVVTAQCGQATATCVVTVNPLIIDVKGIMLSEANISIYVEDTFTLIATVIPEDASDKTVVWTSDDEHIASVDQNGVVTGVSIGTTQIKATAQGLTATCLVTVMGHNGINDILKDSNEPFDIYNVHGMRVRTQTRTFDGLPTGVYVVKGMKIYIK